jgi:hypothetical protein
MTQTSNFGINEIPGPATDLLLASLILQEGVFVGLAAGDQKADPQSLY